MIPGTARRALHAVHATGSALLIATGLLLWDPDLRARLVGGYGREILEAHLWIGAGLLAAPALAGLVAGRALLRDLLRRLGPPDPPFVWAKIHIVGTLVMTSLLGASGLLLWADLKLSPAVQDLAIGVHLTVTWILVASVPVHLVVAWRKTVSRTREILGLVPASELGSEFFDQDDV